MRIHTSRNVGKGQTPTAYGSTVRNVEAFIAGADGYTLVSAATASVKTEIAAAEGVSLLGQVGTRSNHPLVIKTNDTERMRITTAGNVGIGLTPTGTGFLEIKAGTTSAVPFELTAGTNASTAVAGGVEYDGRVFYATPQGTQRGVVPGAQFFRLNAGLVGANANTAQSVFGVGVTLSASTVYVFEQVFTLTKTAGTTSHTLGVSFGGTATLNNIFVSAVYTSNAIPSGLPAGTTPSFGAWAQATNVSITNATAAATNTFSFRATGTVSINAGGTFIPQYTLSAAPGGAYTTVAGSYFLIYPIGASGANTSVGTWA
jgi:hypothetical protein